MITRSGRIQVLLVEDDEIYRLGLQASLSEYPDIEVVGEVDNANGIVNATKALQPDVVLLDLQLPESARVRERKDNAGIRAIPVIKAVSPHSRILVLSQFFPGDPSHEFLIRESINAGADGYIAKQIITQSHDQGFAIVVKIREVMSKEKAFHVEIERLLEEGKALTQRQQDVLALIAQVKSNKEISRDLDISMGAVKVHVSGLLARLGVKHCDEAAAIYRRAQ